MLSVWEKRLCHLERHNLLEFLFILDTAIQAFFSSLNEMDLLYFLKWPISFVAHAALFILWYISFPDDLADLSWSVIPSIHLYFLVLFGIVIVFVARCTIYTTFQSARSTVNITIVNCIYHTNAVQMYCILENHPSWLLQNACQTHPEVRRSHNIMKRYTWEDDRLSSWMLSTYWRELLSVVVHIIWIHCLATDASIMHSFITTCCHHITWRWALLLTSQFKMTSKLFQSEFGWGLDIWKKLNGPNILV